MKIKLREQQLKFQILYLIPLCLIFATDGIYSIQSILPLIAIVFIFDYANKRFRIMKKEMIVFIGFFIISALSIITNAFISPNLITSQSFIRIIYYAVIINFYYSMTSVTYTKRQIDMVIYSLIIICSIISLYFCFVQKIWFVSLFGQRIDKNFVGVFLMLGATLSLTYGLEKKKKKTKFKFFFCYILLLIGIYFSASRATVLFCIVSNLLVIIMYSRLRTKNKKQFFQALMGIILGFITLVLIVLFLYARIKTASGNLRWYWDRYFVNGYGDESVTGRFVWWKDALALFLKRPIWGYGIGNINVSGNSSAVTHNTYLDFLVDQGIIGFYIFTRFVYSSVKGIFKNKLQLYYGVVFAVLLGCFNLSATRSTFLWFSLILLYGISQVYIYQEGNS